MKLVTGIEAIQSGKPFRPSGSNGRWIQPDDGLGSLNAADLLKKGFIIKEEPREFWLDTSNNDFMQAFPGECEVDKNYQHWIRVREIEK